MKERFEIILSDEVLEFLEQLDEKVSDKITYNIRKTIYVNDPKLFKKLTGKIWEFRTKYRKIQYRLLAFWDKRNKKQTLVITTHAIIKKAKKIPKNDIEKAIQAMNRYFSTK